VTDNQGRCSTSGVSVQSWRYEGSLLISSTLLEFMQIGELSWQWT